MTIPPIRMTIPPTTFEEAELRQAKRLHALLRELEDDRGELAEAEKAALRARVEGYKQDDRTHGRDQAATIHSLEPAQDIIDLKTTIRIKEDWVSFWRLVIERKIYVIPDD